MADWFFGGVADERIGVTGRFFHWTSMARSSPMSLAQKVRDIRYSKGWGPDELANRAEISRTALYQIESGKTGLPRAGTLRRIAVALEVPMEDLLGEEDEAIEMPSASERTNGLHSSRGLHDWVSSDEGPLSMHTTSNFRALSSIAADDLRFKMEPSIPTKTNGHDSLYYREGELMSKLHDLLHSPLGEGLARIVEELHSVLPRSRPLV
jgi:transcriptional regulator with XRE-family HTH domain